MTRGFIAWTVGGLLAAASLAVAQPAEEEPAREKTPAKISAFALEFPSDEAARGSVMVGDWDEGDEDGAWETIGGLRGRVEVPVGRKLRVDFYDLGDGGLALLHGVPPRELRMLVVPTAQTDDVVMAQISRFVTLRALHAGGPGVGEKGLRALKGLTDLASLRLTQVAKAPTDAWSFLAKMTQLRILLLTRCELTDAALVHLKPLVELEALNLEGNQLTDAGLEHIAGLTKLVSLTLGGNKLTAAGILKLDRLKDVEKLVLADAEIDDAALGALADRFPSLVWLDLTNTKVTGEGIEALKKLDYLKTLILAKCPIKEANLAKLKELESLRWLDVSDTEVGDASVDALKSLENLGTLNLSGTKIGAAGAAALDDALGECFIVKPSAATPARLKSGAQGSDAAAEGEAAADDVGAAP